MTIWLLDQALSTAGDLKAATDALLATVPADVRARSDAYFEGGYWLALWAVLWQVGVAWLLLGAGWSARWRDWAAKAGRLQVPLYCLIYFPIGFVLELPLVIYRDFWREHFYALATQDFVPWFVERLVELGVTLVTFGLALTLFYALLRRVKARWWLWGAGFGVAFLSIMLTIQPVFIEPLFNDYQPMTEGALKDRILSMARANGVAADDVYVVDASRQSNRISANVSGLFGTMRIALNDTLLHQGSDAEVMAVMGHELGHYVLGHVWIVLIDIGLVLLLGFALVDFGFRQLIARFGWRVDGISDPAGLPLLVALFSVYMFVMTPVLNTIIRSEEATADIFGLNAAREPDGFASVTLKLASYRKLAPGPVEEALLFDHPSAHSRILMAMRWKAEQRDQ